MRNISDLQSLLEGGQRFAEEELDAEGTVVATAFVVTPLDTHVLRMAAQHDSKTAFLRAVRLYAKTRGAVAPLMRWYNDEHRHSGLALLTPHQVHYGLADEVIAQRQRVLDAAHAAHPERFVRGPAFHPPPPREAWINQPSQPTPSEKAAH